jgi:hypothetical protein
MHYIQPPYLNPPATTRAFTSFWTTPAAPGGRAAIDGFVAPLVHWDLVGVDCGWGGSGGGGFLAHFRTILNNLIKARTLV